MARPDLSIFPPPPEGLADWTGQRVGLLGGSFNPAHEAHLEISLVALARLELDAVWWLVSPQNPLKSRADMASLEARLASARAMARDPRIFVTALENSLGTPYTSETLDQITRALPETRFVWLMGADNLAQFTQWKNWRKIAENVVFAIFDRPGYSNAAMTSEAAQILKGARVPEEAAAQLATMTPPAWTFVRDTENPLSSTEIRRKSLY